MSESNDVAIGIALVFLGILNTAILLKTAFTEPGIIPREPDPLGPNMEHVPYAYKQMILKQEGRRKYFIIKKLLFNADSQKDDTQ